MTVHIFKSPFPRIELPVADLPTYWFGALHAADVFVRKASPRPVFVDEADASEELYLDRMETMCGQLASGLYHQSGVRPGDVVAVALPNNIYYLVITLAIHMVGATCMTANPACTPDELNHQLEHSAARFIFTTDAPLANATGSNGHVPVQCPPTPDNIVIRLTSSRDLAETDGRTMASILSALDYPRRRLTALEEVRTSPAFICFSSGTTGLPKAVMLSHYNMVANMIQVKSAQSQLCLPTPGPLTTLCLLPMFHSYGLVGPSLGMPLCGSSVVVMRGFSMDRFLACVERHWITHAPLAPPIINAISRLPPDTKGMSTLAWITSGAGPLSADVIRRLENTFPNTKVSQGYGVTETSPGVSLNVPGSRSITSSGILLPNLEAKVVDNDGRMLGPGEAGELCFRGPNIMMGYLNQPEATKATIGEDGFLRTGDIGYIDADAHVYITDRKKELIKYNGFQVAPAELEGILLQHPSVCDCAVIGVFDAEKQTELPRAFVVLDNVDDNDSTARQVAEWFNAKVAYYKRLRGGCVVVDTIPKSPAGKILRRLLKPHAVPADHAAR